MISSYCEPVPRLQYGTLYTMDMGALALAAGQKCRYKRLLSSEHKYVRECGHAQGVYANFQVLGNFLFATGQSSLSRFRVSQAR